AQEFLERTAHLDDRARDAFEELMGMRRGCQTIEWDKLAEKFELRFQDTINPNNAMLTLKGMKFDRWKDDFTEFSTRFYDMAAKAYHRFDPAALDFAASAALRDHLPLAWLNKLDEAHNEDSNRITFSYERDYCQLMQNTERARSELQRLYSELRKDNGKPDTKKNAKGGPMFNTDTGAPSEPQNEGQRGNGRKKWNRGKPPSAFAQYLPDTGSQQMDQQTPPHFDGGGGRGRGNGQEQHGSWNPLRGFKQHNYSQNGAQ
ncbi:MAG: hypothetical protein GY862_15770, partial [Gammaproteobacteria bacterium]|nr:hypothetical protein [Gammaproteobacteria bacterium]